MNAASLLQAEPVLPIYDGSDLSLKKLALLMDISHSELAQIVQRNIRTIERVRPSTAVLNRLQPLLYALKMLWLLTDGNIAEIQRWLREPLIEWRGLSPLDCLVSDQIDNVVTLVERIYYGDSAGY
ncbi:MAG: antitoxin Xre/MbcA/ParS toxin-binding domain-containing protein [Waterburya sp.]